MIKIKLSAVYYSKLRAGYYPITANISDSRYHWAREWKQRILFQISDV